MPGHTISDQDQLRELIGTPRQTALEKGADRLDQYGKLFLSLCPFICLGTADAEGNATVSPRGDPPGFVTVVDDRTIMIPERPGNRRADTMRNILSNPKVGIVAFVPGIGETLRISGRATLTADPALLAAAELAGRVPKIGIRVEIDDVYFHCAKAIIRSDLWGGRYVIEDGDFPPYAEVLRGQRGSGDRDKIEAEITESYTKRLY